MSIIVKCLGAGAVVGGAYMLGHCYCKSLSEKERFAGKLEEGLRFLEGRIAITEKMLSDVMKECGDKFFEDTDRNVFEEFSERLLKGQEVSQAWQEAVENMKYPSGERPEKEIEVLLKLEHAFSLSDLERYSRGFNEAAEAIKKIREEAEQKRRKEGSAAVKISLCGALAAVLVLW